MKNEIKLNPAIKTVLVIGYVWPEPKSSAAGSHILSQLVYFRNQNCRVIFATPSQQTDHMIDLSEFGIESVEIELNNSSFDNFVAKLNPQLVLFDRFMMEEQFGWRVEQACPNAMRVIDTEDLQSLRGARQEALKQGEKFTTARMKGSDLAKREIAAIFRSDLSLIISEFELTLLQKDFGISPKLLAHLPFLIDNQFDSSNLPSFEQRNHFVTIGNFRHAPNWDSVLYLQKIWPLIRKQIPDAELHIYGSYPPKKATQLNNPKTGFLVKGWAEDANEVIKNARVLLSPLRFGAGIKGKLIDAMLNGTPSVTTDIGAEGMAGNLPWPGCVENDEQFIADAAVHLYQNKEAWEQAQSRITPILSNRYSKSDLLNNLTNKINEIFENLSNHRIENFVGAMLMHHTMKSTQFMSKWIETKNRFEE